MLPTPTFQKIPRLGLFLLMLLLLNFLTKRLWELLLYQLLKIFLGSSKWSVIVKHLAIGCSLARIGVQTRLGCFIRVFLVVVEICFAHTLYRTFIVSVLSFDIFSLHASDGFIIEVPKWLFDDWFGLDGSFYELYIHTLIFLDRV